jgi:hypothetical protein
MIYVESTLEPSSSDAFNVGNDSGITADFIDLLRKAADGEFDPGKLPAGLEKTGLSEVLT